MTSLSNLSRSIGGRVAVVTGAASGMGRATARLLAEQGARVAAVDVQAERLAAEVGEITATGATAVALPADLSDRDAVTAVVAQARRELGPVDILVNNAGVALPTELGSADYLASWDRTFAVNLTAYVVALRACLEDLVRDGEGRVVNVASTEGVGATAYNSAYVAAKHGVVGLTRAAAVELGPTGVRVNAVLPGPIRTGMTELIPDEAKDKFAHRRVPARRYGDPEEVAQMILSLVLPAASFTNGAVLAVDGGLLVQNT
ncbi:MAG: SDR family oxidoreductase [Acidimicrobiales bacterium]|jgi:3-oxoacyl-[acyl-carrier protein] reductase|nr:SDR family oxidoreductase [Acidimicrobiales bacterium]